MIPQCKNTLGTFNFILHNSTFFHATSPQAKYKTQWMSALILKQEHEEHMSCLTFYYGPEVCFYEEPALTFVVFYK